MRLADLPAGPLLLGFVLGPLVETQFRRAMVLSRGDFTAVLERPIAGTVLGISALLLIWTVISGLRRRRRRPEGLADHAAPGG